ncbi:MAG: hypothetical protein ACE5J7_02060 [Candidatus Aenigmatarchaeota archaeon]
MEIPKLPKLTRFDKIAVAALVIFVILVSIPVYTDKAGCEVARPGYKCASAKEVMVEHCEYWGNWTCDSNAHISLPQVEWYIDNLCDIHNRYHSNRFDCANLKLACNQATGEQTCPVL